MLGLVKEIAGNIGRPAGQSKGRDLLRIRGRIDAPARRAAGGSRFLCRRLPTPSHDHLTIDVLLGR